MLDYLPFLIGPKSFGVISLIIFLMSSIIIPMPVFATRGKTQVTWLGISGFVLTVEAVVLVVMGFMVSSGKIFS